MNNRGVVRRISPDKTTITIGLPRGGKLTCRNEGFEIGEEVCFVLDPSCRYVIKVMPRDVAEARNLIAADPVLQHAIMEPPNDIQEDILEQLTKEEEYYYGTKDDSDDVDYRQIIESQADFSCGDVGEFTERGEDYPYISDQNDDGVWA